MRQAPARAVFFETDTLMRQQITAYGPVRGSGTGSFGDDVVYSHNHRMTAHARATGRSRIRHWLAGHACPDLKPGQYSPFAYSISASVLPSRTRSPALCLRDFTVPARGALMACSIFMASITSSVCPAATTSPSFTATLTTTAWHGRGEASRRERRRTIRTGCHRSARTKTSPPAARPRRHEASPARRLRRRWVSTTGESGENSCLNWS